MRWGLLAAGLLAGGINYALLAAGCRRITARDKRGALWLAGGLLVPAAGLALCAALLPAGLLWFGAAAGAVLPLLALCHMLAIMMKTR